jgi:hypothetical protein
VQCRWAIDYGVPSTATKLPGDDVAAKFVAEVRKLASGKLVVPVWTTECEHVDLPKRLAPDGKTTGLCGGVGCSKGTCPKAFTKQWTALTKDDPGPVALLALHGEFERTGKLYPDPGRWAGQAVKYLDDTLPAHGGKPFDRQRLMVVVQGFEVDAAQQKVAQAEAARSGVGVVLTAYARIDQTYQPRVIRRN